MRALKIYCNAHYAGLLTEVTPSHYTFQYDSAYLESNGDSISLTLIKRKEPYQGSHLFPFFSNLLPEGTNRRTICLHQHIDESDSFSLLTYFAGKDIVGNISITEQNDCK